jgi:hypothetical protein
MKKGMLPLKIIFVVVLSQNEVHLAYFAGITMKKTTYLLRSTTCLYVCFQQVSLICDLTTKMVKKEFQVKNKKYEKIKCAKVPKVISNLHVSIFCDISLRLTNCSIFLQKCLPTCKILHFVCPNANQFEGPNTYKK